MKSCTVSALNTRTRQWFKANEMLDKVDPLRIGYRRDSENHAVVVIFRQSELESIRQEYGETFVLVNSRDEHTSL